MSNDTNRVIEAFQLSEREAQVKATQLNLWCQILIAEWIEEMERELTDNNIPVEQTSPEGYWD